MNLYRKDGRMNCEQVAAILARTLEQSADVRREAERALQANSRVPGFGVVLIELVCSAGLAGEIRVAASVALKNFVRTNWGDAPEVEVGDHEQNQLRQMLLEAMFGHSGNLQKLLSNAVFLMAKKDFPERWPTLVAGLASQMEAYDNFEKLNASLSTMDQLFNKYRYESKSTALWTELKACLIEVQAPLTLLYERLVEISGGAAQLSANDATQLFDLLTSVVSVFHSLCTQDLPEFFEDNLKKWVDGMLILFSVTAPALTSGAGEPTPLDRLKTEMCEVVTMYAQRYEDEIKSHMPGLINAIWGLLANTSGETRYDGMVCASMDFLSAIATRPHYEDTFRSEGVLKTLAEGVAIRNMTLRQEDVELFEDEPIEYIKKDLEGTDSGTRRKGAVDLVRALCKRFESELTPILSEAITSCVNAGDWGKRDVVYCLIRGIVAKTETAKQGATSTSQLINIGEFYANYVRPDLMSDVNATPVLKADALRFVVLFRNQLQPETLQETVLTIENLLGSSHPIVHKYAAYALERLLLVRQQDGALLFSASTVPVARLLAKLVGAFDADPKAHNSAYLIKALMRVVVIIDESTARSASEIASKLASLVAAVVSSPADPAHTHYLFETLCVLVKKTSGHVEGGIDRPLLPLLGQILSQDITDLIPYALQLIGLLLTECASRNAPTDAYIEFLRELLKEELWAKTANVPAALAVLESYLRVCPQRVMSEYGGAIMQHYARLMRIKSLDQHGFAMANAILPHVEMATTVDRPLATLLNTMFNRIQTSRTPKFVKNFLVFFFRFHVVCGAQKVHQALEHIQTGMYRMVVEKVIMPELVGIADATSNAEKRIVIIGLGEMMDTAYGALSDLFGTLADAGVKICEGAVVHGNHSTEEEAQAAMYDDEGEFNPGFSRLQQAAPPEVLLPNVVNWKKHFSEVLISRIGGAHPQSLACLPDHVRQTLAVYSHAA